MDKNDLLSVPSAAAGGFVEIPLGDLEPDPFQPRKEFPEGSLRQLAASIEHHGLLQPLLVRPRQGPGSEGKYWIVAGERRYRAAKLLGLESLPCRVQAYQNLTAAVAAMVDNVHREDLSDIDKAEALLRLKQMTEKSWDEIAGLVRLSSTYVRALAGLLKLEEPVKQLVRQGEIPTRTAIALRPLPPRTQVELARRAAAEGLSAEAVRDELRTSLLASTTRSTRPTASPAGLAVDGGDSSRNPEKTAAAEFRKSAAQSLEECVQRLEAMSEWFGAQNWAPGRLTSHQQELLHGFYHAASRLQQQAAQARQPLKEREAAEAEQRRKNPLPF
jgi:ParB/RepB/Spo0J family partition protein